MTTHPGKPVPVNPLADQVGPYDDPDRARFVLDARTAALAAAVNAYRGSVALIASGRATGELTSIRETAAVFETWLLRGEDE